MTTQEQSATPAAEAKPAAPKAPKSYSIRLVGGGAEECFVTAYQNKAGWQVQAVTYSEKYEKGKKRTGTRGTSSTHPTLDAAKKSAEAIAKAFIAKGWVRPERKAFGFARKADAFTLANIPKPAKK